MILYFGHLEIWMSSDFSLHLHILQKIKLVINQTSQTCKDIERVQDKIELTLVTKRIESVKSIVYLQ